MTCVFCASASDFSIMSFDQAVDLLGRLRRRSILNVVLGGGEPFLWPHGLERLVRVAQGLGFLVQVCTNGLSMPEGFESLAGIDRFILPLESMDPRVHDALRGRSEGHHALVLRRIGALAGSGRELSVSTVVTRANVDRLNEIADYLTEVQTSGVAVHAWHLYRFLPVGRGGAVNAERLEVVRADYVRACREVQRRASGFRIFRRSNMLRSSTVEFYWFEKGQLRVGSETFSPQAVPPAGAG
jgi:MoaA/NifB/PqqE/SkfB family radical SAM enzyme